MDENSSESLPQPGPGRSATHGTPAGPGRTDLPCTLRLNTARADPAAAVTDQGRVPPRPDPAALRPGQRPSGHGPAATQAAAERLPGHGTARPGALPAPSPAGRSQREPQAARGGSSTHTDTIASLLPGHRATASRLPRRSEPRPSPTGVQGGPSAAARNQWLGRGGRERAQSQEHRRITAYEGGACEGL